MAFLSGLAVGEATGDPAQLSLLLEFLSGMLGSSPDQITSSKAPSCVCQPCGFHTLHFLATCILSLV